MKLSKYILTSNQIKGRVILTYHDGRFYSIINELINIDDARFKLLTGAIPYLESEVGNLKAIGIIINDDKKANEKLQLWCVYYMRFIKDEAGTPLKYKVTKPEAGKIAYVDVDDRLLLTFFTSQNFLWRGKYDIHTYVKYYNIIRQETYAPNANSAVKPVLKYSRSKEQMLSGAALSQYWEALREAGYQAIYDITGAVVDWRMKTQPNQNQP